MLKTNLNSFNKLIRPVLLYIYIYTHTSVFPLGKKEREMIQASAICVIPYKHFPVHAKNMAIQ